ncbi:MAG: DUF3644 domain-containing protein [Caldilineaceae bacterium]
MPDKKWQRVDKAFTFFRRKALNNEPFTLAELAAFTAWSPASVKTYSTKRWSSFLTRDGEQYRCTNAFTTFDRNTFRQHHSQNENVEKFFYQLLVEKAVLAAVSAIEIYNKPDFRFREESFSILMINAWELLLKAKILQENADNQESIQQRDKDGKVALSASGNPRTISIKRAIGILRADNHITPIVADNIGLLIEIRDEAIHFVHNDPALSVRVQQIGAASLRNFITLAAQWFGYDFTQFNFYLMPISFFHQSDVESFSVDNNAKDNLLRYLKQVESSYSDDADPEFSISLILHTRLVKTGDDDALEIRLTNDPNAPELLISEEDALKGYPYTYDMLREQLRKRYRNFKQNSDFYALKKRLEEQGERFCKERKLDPNNPKSLYKKFYHSRILEEFDKYYEKA